MKKLDQIQTGIFNLKGLQRANDARPRVDEEVGNAEGAKKQASDSVDSLARAGAITRKIAWAMPDMPASPLQDGLQFPLKLNPERITLNATDQLVGENYGLSLPGEDLTGRLMVQAMGSLARIESAKEGADSSTLLLPEKAELKRLVKAEIQKARFFLQTNIELCKVSIEDEKCVVAAQEQSPELTALGNDTALWLKLASRYSDEELDGFFADRVSERLASEVVLIEPAEEPLSPRAGDNDTVAIDKEASAAAERRDNVRQSAVDTLQQEQRKTTDVISAARSQRLSDANVAATKRRDNSEHITKRRER